MAHWKVFCREDAFPGLWRRCSDANSIALGGGQDTASGSTAQEQNGLQATCRAEGYST